MITFSRPNGRSRRKAKTVAMVATVVALLLSMTSVAGAGTKPDHWSSSDPGTSDPKYPDPKDPDPKNPPVLIESCVHWLKQGRVRLGNPSVDQSASNIKIVTNTGEELRLRWWVPRSGQRYRTSPRRNAEFLGLTGRYAKEQIKWIEVDDGNQKPYKVWCSKKSPIGLDIDGSGSVERVNTDIQFDIDGDGTADTVHEWFAPTEGILFDTRVEGPLTGEHLFGDQGGLYRDGFAKLAIFDTNSDGVVSGVELSDLALWRDANTNGVLDAGEALNLVAVGIVSISTAHTNYLSTASTVDGTPMVAEDVWFPTTVGVPSPPSSLASIAKSHPAETSAAAGLLALIVGVSYFGLRRRRSEQIDAELNEILAKAAAERVQPTTPSVGASVHNSK